MSPLGGRTDLWGAGLNVLIKVSYPGPFGYETLKSLSNNVMMSFARCCSFYTCFLHLCLWWCVQLYSVFSLRFFLSCALCCRVWCRVIASHLYLKRIPSPVPTPVSPILSLSPLSLSFSPSPSTLPTPPVSFSFSLSPPCVHVQTMVSIFVRTKLWFTCVCMCVSVCAIVSVYEGSRYTPSSRHPQNFPEIFGLLSVFFFFHMFFCFATTSACMVASCTVLLTSFNFLKS